MKKIVYEPHPVSDERKSELMAQGVKIVDAIFKPAEQAPVNTDAPVEQAPVKRGRKGG